MPEGLPNPLVPQSQEVESSKEEFSLEKYLGLGEKLSQQAEGFPFSGMDSVSYTKRKMEDEEFLGLSTPVDKLLGRFRIHGMKVVLGKDKVPGGGSVYILPGDSENIEDDALAPRHLAITEDMDSDLKTLILANRKAARR